VPMASSKGMHIAQCEDEIPVARLLVDAAMAPQSRPMHADKDDTQRNRQALLAGLLAGAVGFVAFLAYRRHHRTRVGCHAYLYRTRTSPFVPIIWRA